MPDSLRKDNHPKTFQPKDGQPVDKAVQNIQDFFLNNLRRERTLVTIILTGGVKLTGKIQSFDKYALILESNSQDQLVFKHAISTVVAAKTASQTPQQNAEA